MKTDAQIRANRNPNIIPIAGDADAEKFASKLREQAGTYRMNGSNGQVARPWAYRGILTLPKCPKCKRAPDMCYCPK